MSAGLRALIFDVDGTLAETERDGHRVAFNRTFADAGNGWHWEPAYYGELLAVTGGKERLWHHWRMVDPAGAAAADAPRRVRAWHERKTAHYRALVEQGAVGLRPGVKRLLAEAVARGLTLAIATTTTEANVHALLGASLPAPWRDAFSLIAAGDVVPRKKPAPDIYHWVLERLALDPADCLAFEDSAPGAAAAVAAGIPTVLTRGIYSADDTIPGVLCDLDGLGEAEAPAHGLVPGAPGQRPWRGVVDVDRLQAWHRLHPAR